MAPPAPCLEQTLALHILATTDHNTPTTQPAYTRTKPRKGKPIPTAHLQRHLIAHSGHTVVVTGPDYIGCTTLLRLLEQKQYTICLLARKPNPSARAEFQ